MLHSAMVESAILKYGGIHVASWQRRDSSWVDVGEGSSRWSRRNFHPFSLAPHVARNQYASNCPRGPALLSFNAAHVDSNVNSKPHRPARLSTYTACSRTPTTQKRNQPNPLSKHRNVQRTRIISQIIGPLTVKLRLALL
jgi:hypothetical protein